MMRSASLDGYVSLARSFGIDPFKLIDQAGIPRNCLQSPDLKLSISAYCNLLEASAMAAKADDFGVRLAESRQLSTFGPVGLVVREQPTVRRAIAALTDNIRLHNESASLELEETGDAVIVKPGLAVPRGIPAAQAKDMVLGVVCRILNLLLGPNWRPQSVCFVRSAPASLSAHRRVFGSQMDFDQEFNGIICARRDIDRQIAGADPGLAREAERYVALLGSNAARGAKDDVRKIALTLLPTGQCTIDKVAKHLGMDRRTIHRHLCRQETTFSDIVDELRDELAVSYIDRSDRPLSSVATLLGFSGQSAFAHWHQARFGESATERRLRLTRQPR
ncbi:MAG: AraC family transcriptional regulator ligand-binding domain-containing protein [Micropepsaceae bacterium]